MSQLSAQINGRPDSDDNETDSYQPALLVVGMSSRYFRAEPQGVHLKVDEIENVDLLETWREAFSKGAAELHSAEGATDPRRAIPKPPGRPTSSAG